MPELKKEQAQAVLHNEGNLLVSASAGSGKTFVMIERLIRLISEGKASVKQILAVTFTELAASEMKEKLKLALTQKINQTGDKRLVKELAEIPTADICTMHAFCGRLCRAYFYKVGLTPDFKILDGGEADALKHESMNATFRVFYETKEPWFRILTLRHSENRSDTGFKDKLIKMHELCLVNADSELYLKGVDCLYSERGFTQFISEFKCELDSKLEGLLSRLNLAQKSFEIEGNAKVLDFIRLLKEDIIVLKSNADLYVFKKYEGYKLDLPKGVRLKGKLKQVYEDVTAIRDELKELIELTVNGLTDRESDIKRLGGQREHILGIYKILAKYNDIYAKNKREENGVDFSDLEHFTLEILSDIDIRNEVKARYKYAFVDEYQDTNGVQEEILNAVTDNNLFMVGDAKQSIYGFRGCRPEIFLEKLNSMCKNSDSTVLLNHNFRSSGAVIELVNRVFSYSMTKEYFGMNYSDTSMLCGGGVYDEGHFGRTQLHLLKNSKRKPKEWESPRIYDILDEISKPKQVENLPAPTLIAGIIQDELKKDYYDPKLKINRPVTYGDIAVLTRNKDNKYVRDIVKTLIGYGIPVVSVVKENVCDYPEIQTVIGILKLVDCFKQDIPLAVTLKSAVGGFTDEELSEIVLCFSDTQNKGSFSDAFMYYLDNFKTPLRARLKEFYDYFNDLRLIADFVGAHGVLKRIINDKNLEQNLYAESSGRLKVKRLRRFVSASYTENKSLTVKEFLFKIENCPDAFGMSDGAEENSVKVMTIHASKGLEFPVVIVCGLERNANTKEDREEIMFDHNLGFAVKDYDENKHTTKETPVRMIFRHRLRDARLKEELRLFYVALTRASYSLHLTFVGKDGRKKVFNGAKKFLDYVPLDIDVTEHDENELLALTKEVGVRKVIIGNPDDKKVESIKQAINFEYPFISDTTLPLKNSVTKASHDADDGVAVHVLYEESETPDAERGTIAHKILENLDFTFKSDFYAQVDSLINANIISKSQVEKINLERIERALKCPVFELIKDKKLYREKDFIVSVEASKVFDIESKERVLLQGIIDLLAVGENEAVIIDYKYSSLEIESLKRRYKTQLDLYAYALNKSVKKEVKAKALVNLFTGESVVFD